LEDIQLAVDMDPLNLDARRVLAKKLLHLKDWKSLEEICVDGISFHQDVILFFLFIFMKIVAYHTLSR
jgi:hypothetical protein